MYILILAVLACLASSLVEGQQVGAQVQCSCSQLEACLQRNMPDHSNMDAQHAQCFTSCSNQLPSSASAATVQSCMDNGKARMQSAGQALHSCMLRNSGKCSQSRKRRSPWDSWNSASQTNSNSGQQQQQQQGNRWQQSGQFGQNTNAGQGFQQQGGFGKGGGKGKGPGGKGGFANQFPELSNFHQCMGNCFRTAMQTNSNSANVGQQQQRRGGDPKQQCAQELGCTVGGNNNNGQRNNQNFQNVDACLSQVQAMMQLKQEQCTCMKNALGSSVDCTTTQNDMFF